MLQTDSATEKRKTGPANEAELCGTRDLRGVIEREKAEIGALITMEPPTNPMLKEAAEAGLLQTTGSRR